MSTIIYAIVAIFTGLIVPAIGYLIRQTARQLNDATEQAHRLAQVVVQVQERQRAMEETVSRHERILERMR